MSLLEQNITRKGRVDNALPKPEKYLEFEFRGNKEYEVKVVIDHAIFSQQTNDSD